MPSQRRCMWHQPSLFQGLALGRDTWLNAPRLEVVGFCGFDEKAFHFRSRGGDLKRVQSNAMRWNRTVLVMPWFKKSRTAAPGDLYRVRWIHWAASQERTIRRWWTAGSAAWSNTQKNPSQRLKSLWESTEFRGRSPLKMEAFGPSNTPKRW